MSELKFTVTDDQSGARVDVLAAKLLPEFSRSRWQKAGSFLRNGQAVNYKTKVVAGDEYVISCTPASGLPPQLQKWDFPLKVLAESQTWLAIEKPIGVSVHPSESDPEQHTIVNALAFQFSNWQNNFPDLPLRPGIVHRLDKPTSGVLLVSRTDETLRYFQNNWGRTEKWYKAVVTGRPPQSGRIEGAIARAKDNRTKMTVSSSQDAKDAESYFEREAVSPYEKYSLLRVRIPTGRTHQIRVHLSAIGFPILGDPKYGGEDFERLLLHAEELSFPDPDRGGEITRVTCPPPEIFFKKFPDISPR